ncbi:hypothetical protein GCM10011405_03780 [Rufibacter glacialis]|nr:hypothetical protein GCM10011405_03780 [Rufibacter glacialis]
MNSHCLEEEYSAKMARYLRMTKQEAESPKGRGLAQSIKALGSKIPKAEKLQNDPNPEGRLNPLIP